MKISLLLIAFGFMCWPLNHRALGREYVSPIPTFHLRSSGVQIRITEALGANPPQALLKAVQKFPKARFFRVTFGSCVAGCWGGTALYDLRSKMLRLYCTQQTAEYTASWKYLFKDVSLAQLTRIAKVQREAGEGSTNGYFEELKSLGCPTFIKKMQRP